MLVLAELLSNLAPNQYRFLDICSSAFYQCRFTCKFFYNLQMFLQLLALWHNKIFLANIMQLIATSQVQQLLATMLDSCDISSNNKLDFVLLANLNEPTKILNNCRCSERIYLFDISSFMLTQNLDFNYEGRSEIIECKCLKC